MPCLTLKTLEKKKQANLQDFLLLFRKGKRALQLKKERGKKLPMQFFFPFSKEKGEKQRENCVEKWDPNFQIYDSDVNLA